jgi:2-haloacid dehalogenase
MRPLLLFDVNETLLRVDALQPEFTRVFGDPHVMKQWFDALVLYSQTVTLIGSYEDFSTLAEQALAMVAAANYVAIKVEDKRSILQGMLALPAHSEVSEALEKLHASGFRLAALTNSSHKAAESQLVNAGIRHHFERVLSVDAVRKFKPAPETYAYASAELKVAPGEMILIAAHPWDILGAMRAGLRGAFLRRSGKAWFGETSKPEFTAADLTELTEQLLASR